MDHELRDELGFAVVTLHGDIDFNSSPEARKILLQLVDQARDVLVDMSHVKYIDSSGVASLIEAFQSAKSASRQFGLVSVSSAALRVLQLARLEKVLPIYDAVDQAASDKS